MVELWELWHCSLWRTGVNRSCHRNWIEMWILICQLQDVVLEFSLYMSSLPCRFCLLPWVTCCTDASPQGDAIVQCGCRRAVCDWYKRFNVTAKKLSFGLSDHSDFSHMPARKHQSRCHVNCFQQWLSLCCSAIKLIMWSSWATDVVCTASSISAMEPCSSFTDHRLYSSHITLQLHFNRL